MYDWQRVQETKIALDQHRALIVNELIRKEGVNGVYWPALYPDLNPSEYIYIEEYQVAVIMYKI